MLHSLKDSQERLEKLHLYMRNDLYTEENTIGNAVIIPERYASLVKEVADIHTCFTILLYFSIWLANAQQGDTLETQRNSCSQGWCTNQYYKS
jgi:hypothetical protein